jgi:predicted transcriptional regulator
MGSNQDYNERLRLAALKRKYAMMNLRNRGYSDQQIADKCGLTRQRVHKILGPRE